VDAVERVGGETVLDLDITTNRVDCMNVHGVAARWPRSTARPASLETLAPESGPPSGEGFDVAIEPKTSAAASAPGSST